VNIRWGVSPIAWCNDDLPELGGDTPLEKILEDAQAIGFEGIELGNKFPREPVALQKMLDRYSLSLVGGWYSASLLQRSADEEIEALEPHLALLEALGSTVFIIAETSNAMHGHRHSRLAQHPLLQSDDWQRFGDRMSEVARHVSSRGLRLAYHHHLGTVVETADELEQFFAVTSDSVGIVLDTGHATYGHIDPAALVARHPQRIVHVHCKDVRAARHRRLLEKGASFLDGVIDGMFTVPGDGDLDYKPLLRALSQIGYAGWIVVEAEQDPARADPRLFGQLGLDTLKKATHSLEAPR
jgi:inosose dehydratase